MILIQKKRLAAIRAEILAGNPLCLEDATYLADRLLHLLDDRESARKELNNATAVMKMTESQADRARQNANQTYSGGFGVTDDDYAKEMATALENASADYIRGSQSAFKIALRSEKYLYDPLV